MTLKEGQGGAAPSTKKSGGIKLLNLRQVQRKTKNMKDPELVIPEGAYKGYSSVLAYPIFETVATVTCAGHERPAYLSIGELEDDPETLTATPCLTASDSTVELRWDPDTSTVIIEMFAIMASRHITAPKETNIHIPIVRKDLPDQGPTILLQLGKITYQAVERGRSKKKTVNSPTSA